MPLSPEDVVEKRFNPTRVREGYAQDEVDDFLDEVVAELRRLNAENDELRSQLQQCRARVAELSGEEPAPVEVAEQGPAGSVERPAEQAPAAQPVAAGAAVAGAEGSPAGQAAGVIALAQRLHDEYVREGEQQRDALLAAARERAERTVAEAQAQRERTLEELQGRQRSLEEAIAQLHGRESAYREHLEAFMAGQLEELRRAGRVVPEDAVPR
ncbi:DivIVA domain-containing protein [Paenibacillus sp. TRM 82003]|uniref:DivIVA domain-containing protein n=1 Tax=Kineococcus sp. TRM81007 TaxID=2925831 RepID=UPI001F57B095|nr:DivIVA domain-containing protein [Kineococcus sp. TRM81007]MCI2239712.1 DivIVA domain-containing protein [Kineococcus sp. TRM81007]MCI3926725.1 DivIVA domain-containing protein [Paenibacillus sp. TRM 82003]